jgi:hypothetical protein
MPFTNGKNSLRRQWLEMYKNRYRIFFTKTIFQYVTLLGDAIKFEKQKHCFSWESHRARKMDNDE